MVNIDAFRTEEEANKYVPNTNFSTYADYIYVYKICKVRSTRSMLEILDERPEPGSIPHGDLY